MPTKFCGRCNDVVVVEELIPEMSQEKHSNKATISFMGGFAVMMILDIILG